MYTLSLFFHGGSPLDFSIFKYASGETNFFLNDFHGSKDFFKQIISVV